MWRSHPCSLDACEYFGRERYAATQRVIIRKRFLFLNPRTESNRTNSDSHRILDIRIELKYIPIRKAAVAELVDASDLGSGERLLVGVRVSPAAHSHNVILKNPAHKESYSEQFPASFGTNIKELVFDSTANKRIEHADSLA